MRLIKRVGESILGTDLQIKSYALKKFVEKWEVTGTHETYPGKFGTISCNLPYFQGLRQNLDRHREESMQDWRTYCRDPALYDAIDAKAYTRST